MPRTLLIPVFMSSLLLLAPACGESGPEVEPDGTAHLFVWGAAGPEDGPVKLGIMQDSVDGVVAAFVQTAGAEAVVLQSTDPEVVDGDWVRQELAAYATSLGPEDTFVWYAHTHGGEVGMPVVGVRWDELTDLLLDLPARNVVVFMMSCFSGRLIEEMDAVAERWNRRVAEGRNLLVFSAVNADEAAVAVEGINPFAAAVAEALSGEADGGGRYFEEPESWDGETRFSGAVSLEELRLFVPFVTWEKNPDKEPMFTGSYEPLEIFLAD